MTKEQFDRAKSSPDKGVLVHLVCNEADCFFYSDDPASLTGPPCTVLCVETFFGALCDGGFAAWFNQDHGHLAHHCPVSLRRVGLPQYAALADEALKCHDRAPHAEAAASWGEHLGKIRQQHEEEDCTELYLNLDAAFFALFQSAPHEFREKLFAYILDHEQEIIS